jgi:splicing factor 45
VVVEEYDPARPNDYEDYRREKKKKAMEAERLREIERRRQEEEEGERERERDRDRDVNIFGEEAWRRRAAMSGGVPRSSLPPKNGDGFSIGTSGTVGLRVGAGGQMTAAQRMMAKMG